MSTPDDTDRPLDVERLMADLRDRAHQDNHGRPLFEPGPGELHVRPREVVPDSPRRVVGPIVSKGKHAVARAMQPTLDDMAAQVNSSIDQLAALGAEIDALRAAVTAIPDSSPLVDDLRARVDALDALGIAARLARLEAAAPGPTAAASPAAPIDPAIAAVAADRARIDDVGHDRLAAYWAVIDPSLPVLDVSWSSDDAATDLRARGVDVRCAHPDPTTVAQRQAGGLDAVVRDPLDAIGAAETGSLGGIIGIRLGDHLTSEQWLALPRLAAQALHEGGGIVLEMMNSTTPAASALRSRDPSVAPPIHPDTVAFLLRTAGFRDVEVRYLGSFPDEMCAPLASDPDWFERQLNEMSKVINRLVVGQPLVAVLARK